RREILDIDVAGTELHGIAIQNRVAALCQEWLPPALDAAFEHTVPADEHWVLDRLEIDAGRFTADNFERDFVGAVVGAVTRQFGDYAAARKRLCASAPSDAVESGDLPAWRADEDDAISRRTPAEAAQEAFLHFLKTGLLPWWFRVPHGETLEEI